MKLLPLFALLGLAACGGSDHDDVRLWMEGASHDLHGRVPPLPELKPFPVVSYEASSYPDPFSSRRIEPEKKEGGGKRPDFDRPKEQLESYPLEALRFIGVVSKEKGKARHALILAEGLVYPVIVGNYVGQNYGRITRISDGEIMLTEIVQDPSGQTSDWVEKEVTLEIQDGFQGKEAKK